MPSVTVLTSTGETRFQYTISTPTSASAERIEPALPTLLFFHCFAFHNVFHSQFSDQVLRKFNLVCFDLRWHGETLSDIVPPKYGQEEAAEDAIAFINALQLPPCHFIALDLGSNIALQVAVKIPQQALSLFIMSHVCLDEVPDTLEGRTEMYEIYISDLPNANIDVGVAFTQYAFSNNMSNLALALRDSCIVIDSKNWSREHLEEYRLISYEIFRSRKALPLEALSRISCPVKLIHGGGSIVYSISYTEAFMQELQEAGVNVSMEVIPYAPHYLCVDYADVLNPMIYDFVVESLQRKSNAPLPTAPLEMVVSPWDKMLRDYGWNPERKHELDDDDFVVSYPTR
ncbi:Alpha/Beta hydrolase protein [Lentinula raphanica]|uniref:Alpha/Beta hydrolase protein n=1 Tax=Lentinula raphanica TaxID=153919 RepID=A0AA38UI14_9AGAR|nr:Alpha/Beta hydrolase protein [Lentinula raphanica]